MCASDKVYSRTFGCYTATGMVFTIVLTIVSIVAGQKWKDPDDYE